MMNSGHNLCPPFSEAVNKLLTLPMDRSFSQSTQVDGPLRSRAWTRCSTRNPQQQFLRHLQVHHLVCQVSWVEIPRRPPANLTQALSANVPDRRRPRQVDGVCLHRHSPSSRRRGAAALGSRGELPGQQSAAAAQSSARSCAQGHSGLSASARATGPHREFNKYFGAPKTQPDVERRRGSGSIEINQILSATSRETLFSGTDCPGLVIAPVYYYRRLLSPTSDTHIGLLSPPFSASATSWRLLGHQQAQF